MSQIRGKLYYHEQYDCYECLGCKEVLEVPFMAVLKNGQPREYVKRNPENRLVWVELMQAGHARCHLFQDEEKARQDRERVRVHPAHPLRLVHPQ